MTASGGYYCGDFWGGPHTGQSPKTSECARSCCILLSDRHRYYTGVKGCDHTSDKEIIFGKTPSKARMAAQISADSRDGVLASGRVKRRRMKSAASAEAREEVSKCEAKKWQGGQAVKALRQHRALKQRAQTTCGDFACRERITPRA